jgi:hypothetical protein
MHRGMEYSGYLRLLAPLWRGLRKIFPSQDTRVKAITDEFAHAARLKREVEENTKWDQQFGTFGEFLIRDIERALPETQEKHSSKITPYSIVGLAGIEREHLEFTYGNFGIQHIKQIGDSWYFSDHTDEEATKVETVFWLNYRDIVLVRWERDDYWEWPQVCCRFPSPKKFPFSRIFFAERKTGLPRPFYHKVCDLDDVGKLPESLAFLRANKKSCQ